MTARKTLFVILGILMILAGITCFFTPVETSSVIPFIFGLAMVIDGIGRIVAWFSIREYAPRSGWVLASSIISLVFGLMLTTSPMLQVSVGVFVVLLTGWWILALGIIRIVHAFHLLKIKRESPDFVFGEMIWAFAWRSGCDRNSQPAAGAWCNRRGCRLWYDYSRNQSDLPQHECMAVIRVIKCGIRKIQRLMYLTF